MDKYNMERWCALQDAISIVGRALEAVVFSDDNFGKRLAFRQLMRVRDILKRNLLVQIWTMFPERMTER